MPTYAFRKKSTGEEWTQYMGIAERDEFLSANPDVETFPNGAPMIHSGAGLTRASKPSDYFKDRLREIKKANHKSTVNIP